jgi:hypothetical protein
MRVTHVLSGQYSWLQTQMSRVRIPMLPDFPRSGSETGSTQPWEVTEELLG